MFTHREAGQPAGGEVLDGGQVERALVGGDLGQVIAPALIDPLGAEVPAYQVRDRRRRLVGRVRDRRRRFGDRPDRPWRAIDAATVLTDTFQPASTRSANIRGDP